MATGITINSPIQDMGIKYLDVKRLQRAYTQEKKAGGSLIELIEFCVNQYNVLHQKEIPKPSFDPLSFNTGVWQEPKQL
jgi:hypothetical protein